MKGYNPKQEVFLQSLQTIIFSGAMSHYRGANFMLMGELWVRWVVSADDKICHVELGRWSHPMFSCSNMNFTWPFKRTPKREKLLWTRLEPNHLTRNTVDVVVVILLHHDLGCRLVIWRNFRHRCPKPKAILKMPRLCRVTWWKR